MILVRAAPLLAAPAVAAAAGSWQQTFAKTLNADEGSWNGYTLRQPVPAASISVSGTKMRTTFEGGSVEGVTLSAVYFQEAAAAGDAFDFATTPVQVTFDGGSGSVVIGAGASKLSDEITVTVDETKSYVFAFFINGGTGSDTVRRVSDSGNGYYKLGNDVTTVNATGYSPASLTFYLINKIEVFA